MAGTMIELAKAAADRLTKEPREDGFEAQALHEYTDAKGAPVFYRIRMKHPISGEKWIRPMRWDGGRYVLGEPRFPNRKPLYRLHEICERLDVQVIVTEGEHKADQLAMLGVLVTTSGGATSAGAADWHPLAGREVVIWPDNDDAGMNYATEVTNALLALGCSVRVLDVIRLGLEAKGDAADWLSMHPTATASDVLALPCVPPPAPEASPDIAPDRAADGAVGVGQAAAHSFCHAGGRFELTQDGLVFTPVDASDRPIWVCSQIRVIAKTRDTRSGEWGRLLQWSDDDGVRHLWAMPMELLEGDGADLRRELARQGVQIATTRTARDLLAAYIKFWPSQDRARCVERLGWHHDLYVTPDQMIGDSEELVVFRNSHATEPAVSQKGCVSEWRDSVAKLASGNTRLVFALSAAFAGPLAHIAGDDSGGFHMRGRSSSGKSTALRVAASVWGDPSTYVRVWRATANGLEGLAALHNDSVLILDELSQCDPREAGAAAYLLANGQGKVRANVSGAARASQRWRLLFLSAGEESLATLMARAGSRPNAGQEIRLADFDADAGAGMGALEELHGYGSAAALVMAIKESAGKYYGAVGMEWLRSIVRDRAGVAQLIEDGVRQFVAEAVCDRAGGQVERVARRFALVAIAGELATHFGLTGWQEHESDAAAKACFASWLESFGGGGNREDQTLLTQVRAFFEAHGASRFEDMDATKDQRIINRAGFYRSDPSGAREFLVLPEVFRRDLCAGLDLKAALKLLVAKGWIQPGGDGRPSQKLRLPGIGAPSRVYVISTKIWETDE